MIPSSCGGRQSKATKCNRLHRLSPPTRSKISHVSHPSRPPLSAGQRAPRPAVRAATAQRVSPATAAGVRAAFREPKLLPPLTGECKARRLYARMQPTTGVGHMRHLSSSLLPLHIISCSSQRRRHPPCALHAFSIPPANWYLFTSALLGALVCSASVVHCIPASMPSSSSRHLCTTFVVALLCANWHTSPALGGSDTAENHDDDGDCGEIAHGADALRGNSTAARSARCSCNTHPHEIDMAFTDKHRNDL